MCIYLCILRCFVLFCFFVFFFFFFHDTATTEIYTLSLHDALPISLGPRVGCGKTSCAGGRAVPGSRGRPRTAGRRLSRTRSEEHTSELQSLRHLVCRLLLEKKKKKKYICRQDTNRSSQEINRRSY